MGKCPCKKEESVGAFLRGALQQLLFFVNNVVFFFVDDVSHLFEKPLTSFSLHLEFKYLSSSMIFFIGSRCHLFILFQWVNLEKWIILKAP